MEQKNSLTIELAKQDIEDFNSFCKINEITDPNGFVKLCWDNLHKDEDMNYLAFYDEPEF